TVLDGATATRLVTAQYRVANEQGAWADIINGAAPPVGEVIVQLVSVYQQIAEVIDGAAALRAVEDADGVVVQVAARQRQAAARIDVQRAAKESGVAGELAVADRQAGIERDIDRAAPIDRAG